MRDTRFYLLFLVMFPALYFAQETKPTYLDFMNEQTSIYPGCEDAVNKQECMAQVLGTMILDKLNEFHKAAPLREAYIKMDIELMSKSTGRLFVTRVQSNDSIAQQVAAGVLDNLPDVALMVTPEGEPITASNGFSVAFQRDYDKDTYSLIYNTKTHEWLKMAHPMVFVNAVFEGCTPEKSFLSECFWEHFNVWRAEAFPAEEFGKFAGQKGRIAINVGADGITEYYNCEAAPKLKKAMEKAVEQAWESFPKLLPSTLNGELNTMTYRIPVEF